MSHSIFEGSAAAVVTPMNGYGNLDFDAFGRLLEWMIREGTPCLPLPPMLYLSQSMYFLSQANSWLSAILTIISENLCFSKNNEKAGDFRSPAKEDK